MAETAEVYTGRMQEAKRGWKERRRVRKIAEVPKGIYRS